MVESRIGEKYLSTNSGWMEIICYNGVNNCSVIFDNGDIRNNLSYHNIKKGNVKNIKAENKLGKKYTTREGYEITIIEYINKLDCSVIFDNGYKLENTSFQNVKKGLVKNPYHRTIYGIGFLGSGKYSSSNNGKNTEIYKRWRGMFSRCYDNKLHDRQPKYKDCTVIAEWHNFQVFAEWFENNYIEGFHLDKDILIKGNKVYSPETCCFVPQEINSVFTTIKNTNYFYFRDGNYEVTVCNRYIGRFSTKEEAFQAYKTAKEAHIKEIADKWRGQITEQTYQTMYIYEIESNE